nr:hypothetical protein [Tanacetum cinerariifolium]
MGFWDENEEFGSEGYAYLSIYVIDWISEVRLPSICVVIGADGYAYPDYSLWEVILNGDSPSLTRVVDGAIQIIAPATTEQRLAKKNEMNARGILLMALPDKCINAAGSRLMLFAEINSAAEVMKKLL